MSTSCNSFFPEKLEEIFPGIIGTEMGQLKLEQEIDKAVFLSPKCYLLETVQGEKVIKIKGLSLNNLSSDISINLDLFINLLKKDSIANLNQDIWVKNKSEALISIINQTYSLAHNSNKRTNVYDSSGFFIDSLPINVDNESLKIENKD